MEQKMIPVNPQQGNDEIDLLELLFLYLDHIWAIILCMVLCGSIAFGYAMFLKTPTYSATAKLYMFSADQNALINLSTLTKSTSIKNDYQEILTSRSVLEQVNANLKLNRSVNETKKMLKISMPTDTNILMITATSASPQMAMDVANEMASQAMTSVPTIMDCTAPNLLESAIFPASSNGRGVAKMTAVGMMAGMVLCCGFLTVKHLMNDTFRSPEDLQRYVDVSVLAAIPEADPKDIGRNAAAKKRASAKNGGN